MPHILPLTISQAMPYTYVLALERGYFYDFFHLDSIDPIIYCGV